MAIAITVLQRWWYMATCVSRIPLLEHIPVLWSALSTLGRGTDPLDEILRAAAL